MIRDFQQDRLEANRYLYTNVLIRERHNPTSFTLQPERMQPFEAVTCTPQNWQAGEKMRHLQFRWTPDCDNVAEKGSFEFYSENGKRVNFTQEIEADAR